ncbi:MAG: dynamin family protein [Ignavibacteriaceae bacterium]|jgi:GTPase Era involved in 16S rRNA processing
MQFTEQYSDKFDCLIQLSNDYNQLSFAAELKLELKKLKNEYLYLAVIGQFKRGKSSLINSLIGIDILPTAVLPLTSMITMIKFGEEQIVNVIFEDDKELLIPGHELFNYTTESGNPSNIKKVRFVEILYPSEFLKDGIILIDTPGIGSLFLHNTKSTESFIPKIDAAIFVLSIDPPITQTEFQFFEDIRLNVDKLYFVMNKIDLVSENAQKEVINYTKNILTASNHNLSPKIFPVSAKDASEAKMCNDKALLSQSGITALEDEIKSSIKSEKVSILRNNLQKKLDRFTSRLSFSLELELNALKTPINIFEDKIKQFNYEMYKIIREKKLALYNFNGQIDDLIIGLEIEMRDFNKRQAEGMFNSVTEYLMSLHKARKANLLSLTRDYFASKLTSDFEYWRLKFEARLYQNYLDIIKASALNINELIKKTADISAGLFNISSPLLLEEITFEKPSEFVYRTKDEPLFLEIDMLKIISYFYPRRFFIKLLLSRMEKEVEEKTMVNSGNVFSFYRVSILDTAFKFKYDMDEKTDQIIFYINSTISAALKNISISEQQLEPRLEKITKDLLLLNSIKLIENE